jgi:putative endonuclease
MIDRARKEVGADGEQLALDYLLQRGLRLVTRNHQCKGGELDLVMLDGATLAVVEVRLRSDPRFGGAAASITSTKQKRIIIAAKHLLLVRRELARHRARFDVVAIDKEVRGQRQIEWIKDAFRI